ncbi:NusG domain II-containing protein [Clostridium fermenticellae]|uniref:NusG domain II-containing protein n=1 Tax=Clostridium fermenticellae TaxID=2068654 RepID=A0A386H4D4_9CLOT|nr:NusG domain II-containing protein [Clostridium fermenticellae]AYD40562.1 NusG domain II-containing protein [Clostridium fermenticellae]
MKKGDKIISILVLCLIILSFIGVYAYKQYEKGSHHIAIIKQNGTIIKTIDLDKVSGKNQFKVTYNKTHYNVIQYEKGKIRFLDADCPDKICVKTGWISEGGQSAACLPHKLLIKINGGKSKVDQVIN